MFMYICRPSRSQSSRHEYYETDEKVTLSIFDKGADPEKVSVEFEPRRVRFSPCLLYPCYLCVTPQLVYKHDDRELVLQPLKGQIDPAKSEYTVGKVKVEIRLAKLAQGRWGALVGDEPDRTFRTRIPITAFN